MRDLFLNNCNYSIQVKKKVWLEINGQRFFGEGRAQLFRLIQETNSINASAKAMGISFRRAWAMVKDMEDALNILLVEKKRGGVGGGSTILTPTGMELLEHYEKILKDFNTLVDT